MTLELKVLGLMRGLKLKTLPCYPQHLSSWTRIGQSNFFACFFNSSCD